MKGKMKNTLQVSISKEQMIIVRIIFVIMMMKMLIQMMIQWWRRFSTNIISRCRSRHFRINPRCSSYIRGRVEYLTRRSYISALISNEFCQNHFLKHMDFKFALEKRKRYLSTNKSMQNSYLVGCMQSTLSGYDNGSLFISRKALKMFHSMVNFYLSRIQENLEKDPTFYSEVRHKW